MTTEQTQGERSREADGSAVLEVSRNDLSMLCNAVLEDWITPAHQDSGSPATCRFCGHAKEHPWPDFNIRTSDHDANCPVLVAVSCQPNND